jgi:hypothetical protein
MKTQPQIKKNWEKTKCRMTEKLKNPFFVLSLIPTKTKVGSTGCPGIGAAGGMYTVQ